MAIIVHIHPPVWWFFPCGFWGHDIGCAGLPAEVGCNKINMGKNRGNYLCIHVLQNELAQLEALEAGVYKIEGEVMLFSGVGEKS